MSFQDLPLFARIISFKLSGTEAVKCVFTCRFRGASSNVGYAFFIYFSNASAYDIVDSPGCIVLA